MSQIGFFLQALSKWKEIFLSFTEYDAGLIIVVMWGPTKIIEREYGQRFIKSSFAFLNIHKTKKHWIAYRIGYQKIFIIKNPEFLVQFFVKVDLIMTLHSYKAELLQGY